MLSGVADSIGDPSERKRKAFEFLKNKREMAQAQAADDPMHGDASSYRAQLETLMPTMKGKLEGMTLAQMERGSPLLLAKLRGDVDRENARIAAGGKAADKAEAKAEKAAADQKERTTPFGVARTPDDAKNLKAAAELKSNFDSKLQEMIELRKKHGGGQMLNRDDQARGKALSDDLLLAYKDLSKLGVMSKTDEAILRRIIPADPLQYNSPLAAIQGQDPTMTQMTKFKSDSDADFQTRLKNRIEGYEAPAAPAPMGEFVSIKAPDGRIKKVPRSQVDAALQAGGTLADPSSTAGR